jgi:uncharacterized protein (DUF1501 family)
MLSRRQIMKLATACALTAAPLRLAFAAAEIERRLVVLVLRGAMDGLHAVPPVADPAYRRLRGDLALPLPGEAGGALSLDDRFALHPALATMKQIYDAGEMTVLHAVASPYRDRSHFDGQELLENGSAKPHGASDGWLNRVLMQLPGGAERRLGLAVGSEIPLLLRGDAAVAAWAPDVLPPASDDFLDRVAAMYGRAPELGQALQAALDTRAMARVAGISNGGGKGRQQISALADTIGRMLSQPNGPRVAVMDVPGWDTHSGQAGRMNAALTQLDAAMASLRASLGQNWRETMVVTLTEFGRTAVPNGSGGTDHGTATAIFLAGGAVAGGRVITDWPGLAEVELHQGRDLAPTADMRNVLAGAVGAHLALGPASLGKIFPGADLVPVRGLVRS